MGKKYGRAGIPRLASCRAIIPVDAGENWTTTNQLTRLVEAIFEPDPGICQWHTRATALF
jgi:hypothetical protein